MRQCPVVSAQRPTASLSSLIVTLGRSAFDCRLERELWLKTKGLGRLLIFRRWQSLSIRSAATLVASGQASDGRQRQCAAGCSLPKMGFGFASSSLIAEISAIRTAFRLLFSTSSNFSYPPRLEFS